MRWTLGAAALLCTGVCSAEDLRIQRIEGVVTTIVDGETQKVGAPTPLATGNGVETGAGSRAGLQITGGGSVVVGIDSRVVLDGSKPPDPPARSALLNLRLETGALRIDARKQDKQDAADIRLLTRFLSMRIYGAEAFVLSGPEGDEVCVLSGAIEVKTPRADERIDRPLECLRWTDVGTTHFEPDRRDNLAADMLQTSFSDDHHARYAVAQEMERVRAREAAKEARAAGFVAPPVVAATRVAPAPAPVVAPPDSAVAPTLPAPVIPIPAPPAVAAQTPAPPVTEAAADGESSTGIDTPATAIAALPAEAATAPSDPATASTSATTTEVAAAPSPASSEAPASAAVAATGVAPSPEWHIVLFTFSTMETAQRAVTALAPRRLNLQIRETTALGRTYYRVTTPPFASMSEANIALERLRRYSDFSKAWILPP